MKRGILPVIFWIMYWFAVQLYAQGDQLFSWRYYTPTNTGIQGDEAEAVWIDTDGNPWIAAYNPVFEEGGFSKFDLASSSRSVTIRKV